MGETCWRTVKYQFLRESHAASRAPQQDQETQLRVHQPLLGWLGMERVENRQAAHVLHQPALWFRERIR